MHVASHIQPIEKSKPLHQLLSGWITRKLKYWRKHMRAKIIIRVFCCLQDLQKYTLLMEIADSEIERLCISLIIPVVRPNSVKVFSHILCSAQSRELFMKIVPRIPKVFQTLSSESPVPPDAQLIVDLVSAFIHRYGAYDLKFSEIVSPFPWFLHHIFRLNFKQ